MRADRDAVDDSPWALDAVYEWLGLGWDRWDMRELALLPEHVRAEHSLAEHSLAFWFGDRFQRLWSWISDERAVADAAETHAVEFGVLDVIPVQGAESSGYGYRRHPISGRRKFHKGVDFKAPRGTPVYAAASGVVTVARRNGSYGRLIIISHGLDLETRYAHLRQIHVEEGEFVSAGELIGTVGSSGRTTGPHLHFEVRRSGEAVNPYWALGTSAPSMDDERVSTLAHRLSTR